MTKKESIYAEALRELGFVHVDKRPKEVDDNGSEEGAFFEDIVPPPWFLVMEHVTYVVDETMQIWSGPGGVRISHMGFRDITEDYLKHAEERDSAAQTYN